MLFIMDANQINEIERLFKACKYAIDNDPENSLDYEFKLVYSKIISLEPFIMTQVLFCKDMIKELANKLKNNNIRFEINKKYINLNNNYYAGSFGSFSQKRDEELGPVLKVFMY